MARTSHTNGIKMPKTKKTTTVNPKPTAAIEAVKVSMQVIGSALEMAPGIIDCITESRRVLHLSELKELKEKMMFLEKLTGTEIPGEVKFSMVANRVFPRASEELGELMVNAGMSPELRNATAATELITAINRCYGLKRQKAAMEICKKLGIDVDLTDEDDE